MLCFSLDIAWEISLARRRSSRVKLLAITVHTLRASPFPAIGKQFFADIRYRMLVGYVVKLVAIVSLYLYMYSVNKRRDREAIANLESDEDGVENGMLVGTGIGDRDGLRLTRASGPNGDRQQGFPVRVVTSMQTICDGCK